MVHLRSHKETKMDKVDFTKLKTNFLALVEDAVNIKTKNVPKRKKLQNVKMFQNERKFQTNKKTHH